MDRPVALITGGARRVGRAIALHLASHGYDLIITYLHSDTEAKALQIELEALNAQSLLVQADFAADNLPATVADLVAQVARFRPRLDALINNASIYRPDDSLEPAMSMYQLHCQAPLLLSRLLAPLLKRSRGCIINMCDILGARPLPGWLNYCASKAALANITVGLARELAPEIRVCGIAPGVAQWPDDYEEKDKEKYLKRVPLQRAGTAEEVAGLVRYLLTEGTYITGQIISIDGGRTVV